jgi:hypothetical protein
MKTDELINVLTQMPPTGRPPRLGLLAVIVTALSAFATIAILGLRPELAAGQPPPGSFWIKTLLLAGMAIVSLIELERVSKPLAMRPLWPVIALAVDSALCVVSEWQTVDYRSILGGFLTPNFPSCLICVTAYGVFGMAGFTVLMRHYAPADTRQCAGLIGLAAAASAAVGYSIHCPIDSPTFVVVAYGMPMIALWLIGRLLLPRKLNW